MWYDNNSHTRSYFPFFAYFTNLKIIPLFCKKKSYYPIKRFNVDQEEHTFLIFTGGFGKNERECYSYMTRLL